MKVVPGTVIERYSVVQPLGTGGMATVWLARHERLGSLHALKVLEIPSPEIRERLVREGQVQGQVRHLNILSVTDVLEFERCPCLLMELVTGPPLDVLIKRRVLNLDQIDDLARQILAGVSAAHAAGLVHRDLKPANVLLQPTEETAIAKVADFGLAKVLSSSSEVGRTRSGMAMGTPSYMAPEQIRDASRVDARADVFSLGALLYRLTTGQRPFEGADTFEIFTAVANGERLPVRTLAPHLPDRMVNAIEQALQLDRDDRPHDAGALRELWVADTPPPETPWTAEELEDLLEQGPRLPDGSSVGSASFTDATPSQSTPALPASSPISQSEPTFHADSVPHAEPSEPGQPAASAKETWEVTGHEASPHSPLATDGAGAREAHVSLPQNPNWPPPPRAPSPPSRRSRFAALAFAGTALLTAGAYLAVQQYQARLEETFLVAQLGFEAGAVQPLGERLTAVDSEAWRVTTRGGRLIEALRVNAYGHRVPDLTPPGERSITSHFRQHWGDDGPSAIESLTRGNRRGDRLEITQVSDALQRWSWVDQLGHPEDQHLAAPMSFLPTSPAYEVALDGEGRVAHIRNLDLQGEPNVDDRRRWAVRLSWSDDGELLRETTLDERGSEAPDATGIVTTVRTYNERGHEVSQTHLGLGSLPVVNLQGWHRSVREVDDTGRITTLRFEDHQGALITPSIGDASCPELRMDWSRTQIDERCFGPEGSEDWTTGGWHHRRTDLDERGYPRVIALFSTQGVPVRGSRGAASWAVSYNNIGRIATEGPFFDPTGAAIPSVEGWSSRRLTYNDSGYLSQALYLDGDDQPIRGPLGAPLVRYTYSEHGTQETRELYDGSGQPTIGTEHWHIQQTLLSDDHRTLTGHHFGRDKQPTYSSYGVMSWVERHDERQNPIDRTTLGPDGKPQLDLTGFASHRRTRDRQGNATSSTFLDAEGNPVVPRDQEYAMLKRAFDAHGNPVAYEFFMPDGEPAHVNPLGASQWRQTFDSQGRLTELALYDDQGELLEGCARIRYRYDLRGNETRQACHDRDGVAVAAPGEVWHASATEYDALGRPLISTFLDVNGEPVLNGDYAQHRYTYQPGVRDAVMVEQLDASGALVAGDLVASQHTTYNSVGEVTAIAFRDHEGNLMEHRGAARREWSYDDRTFITETRSFLADGSLGDAANGVPIRRFRHDDRGNMLWLENLGAWGQRVPGPEGHHAEAYTYDALNRITTAELFDVDLKPTRRPTGAEHEKVSYDDFGHESRRTLFDGAGQPTTCSEGWHIRHTDNDPYGQPLEVRFLDTQGLPTNNHEGYQRQVTKRDFFANITEQRHYDKLGEPVADASGVHATLNTYNRQRRLAEQRFEGPDGELTVGPDGYARRTLTYDSQGQLTEEVHFDEAGMRLN